MKEDISWQLREMKSQGIGCVEQISMQSAYEKGNAPYLSDEFFDLARHAMAKVRDLDMTVFLDIGCRGRVCRLLTRQRK